MLIFSRHLRYHCFNIRNYFVIACFVAPAVIIFSVGFQDKCFDLGINDFVNF